METYPTQSATLCARMSRGFNGQDIGGLCPVYPEFVRGVYQKHSTQTTTEEQEREAERRENGLESSGRKYVLRRLTPLECLRLQGLPDWWVDGCNGSDSAIYKLCGNGLAIPCAYDVMRRIAGAYEKEERNG